MFTLSAVCSGRDGGRGRESERERERVLCICVFLLFQDSQFRSVLTQASKWWRCVADILEAWPIVIWTTSFGKTGGIPILKADLASPVVLA